MERKLFIAQRLSAMCLAPLVLIHLGLILYAVRNGLTGEEILQRTQGNLWWGVFYGIFVVAVAVHAPIGLRNILHEWSRLDNRVIARVMLVFAVFLLVLGLRSVFAVV